MQPDGLHYVMDNIYYLTKRTEYPLLIRDVVMFIGLYEKLIITHPDGIVPSIASI